MSRGSVDPNGYAAGERNRRLSPEEVFTAREDYFAKRVTARQLAFKFGLSTDSVRRMLRSETYANVGDALPRAEELDRSRDLPGADEMLERLMEVQGKVEAGQAPEAAPTGPTAPSALDQFLTGKVDADPMEGEDTSGLFGKP